MLYKLLLQLLGSVLVTCVVLVAACMTLLH